MEGGLAWVLSGKAQFVLEGALARADWDKCRLLRMKQLGQDEAGEARTDGIRGRDHNARGKSSSGRERAPPG